MRRLALNSLLCWLYLGLFALSVAAQPAGMLLDVRGVLKRGDQRVGVFQSLGAGQVFELSKDGEATVAKTGTNHQWRLRGPLTFKMTDEGPVRNGLSGTIVELERQVTRVTAPVKGVDISRTGGVRRSMLWVTSDPGQLTMPPTITWETAGRFDNYALELQDEQGEAIYSTKISGDANSYVVPASVALKPGATYFIALQGQQGARGYTCNGRLRVVPEDQSKSLAASLRVYREEFEKTGNLSFLSLSVLELADLEINSQLPALLQEMAEQRPGDPSITAILDRLSSNQRRR